MILEATMFKNHTGFRSYYVKSKQYNPANIDVVKN